MPHPSRLLAAALLLLLPALPAWAGGSLLAPTDPDAARYAACMQQARQHPQDGWDTAEAWIGLGGGAPARHCAAVALVGMGQYKGAAERLEKLAETARLTKDLKAGLLAQAAQARLLDNDDARALADQDAALKLTPKDPALLTDRGVTLASMRRYWKALDDFNAALALSPDRVGTLVFRASTYRFLKVLPLASDDLRRALDLDPHSVAALLERGIVRRLQGDKAGARADWLQVVALRPHSAEAREAQNNLALMDVHATPLPGH